MARGVQAAAEEPHALILDAGAVIALARGDARARGHVARAVRAHLTVHIPSVVVAETVRGRGPRDAAVNRVIASVDDVIDIDEGIARDGGALLGASRSAETIDALIVASAARFGGGRILTGDVEDLKRLARHTANVIVQRL